MQNQEFNMARGVLFALGAAIAVGALWTVLIGLLSTFDGNQYSIFGAGGFIGGAIAGILGSLAATAYRLGKGKPDIVGMVIVGLVSALAAAGAVIMGFAWVFPSVSFVFELAEFDSDFGSSFWLAVAIATAVAAVVGAITVKAAVKKDETPPTPPAPPQA